MLNAELVVGSVPKNILDPPLNLFTRLLQDYWNIMKILKLL